MKLLAKITMIAVVLYLVLTFIFWISGVCPKVEFLNPKKYVDPVRRAYNYTFRDQLRDTAQQVYLCPFIKKIY